MFTENTVVTTILLLKWLQIGHALEPTNTNPLGDHQSCESFRLSLAGHARRPATRAQHELWRISPLCVQSHDTTHARDISVGSIIRSNSLSAFTRQAVACVVCVVPTVVVSAPPTLLNPTRPARHHLQLSLCVRPRV